MKRYKPTQIELAHMLIDGKKMRHSFWYAYYRIDLHEFWCAPVDKIIDKLDYFNPCKMESGWNAADGKTEWTEYQQEQRKEKNGIVLDSTIKNVIFKGNIPTSVKNRLGKKQEIRTCDNCGINASLCSAGPDKNGICKSWVENKKENCDHCGGTGVESEEVEPKTRFEMTQDAECNPKNQPAKEKLKSIVLCENTLWENDKYLQQQTIANAKGITICLERIADIAEQSRINQNANVDRAAEIDELNSRINGIDKTFKIMFNQAIKDKHLFYERIDKLEKQMKGE